MVESALAQRGHRRRGLAQGRGRQPDRLVQGPRHDRGALGRGRAGREAVVCASTGNTSASMAAYAARAGIKPLVLVPQGKIAAGKLAQAIVHGAQVIMVRGNFDDCLRVSRGLADALPGRAGELGEPDAAGGPEDRVLRDRGLPRRRPGRPRAAGRQRRQHLGVLAGLPGGDESGDATRLPVMRGWQAAGAAPLVQGSPVPDPRPLPRPSGSATRRPGTWRSRRRTSRRHVPPGDRRPDPAAPARPRLARRGLRRAGLGRRRWPAPARGGGGRR